MKKILHLTLKKEWFDLIASGKKKVEYREVKRHWVHRLLHAGLAVRMFDEVHFRNGYNNGSPFMRVEWKDMNYEMYDGKKCFAIKLGKVLEIRNWKK